LQVFFPLEPRHLLVQQSSSTLQADPTGSQSPAQSIEQFELFSSPSQVPSPQQ
jgi:hypothetical protein